MDSSPVISALEAKMAAVRAQALRDINASLFADNRGYQSVSGIQTRTRLQQAITRIQAYFNTLGKALRGVDLIEADDYDY